MHSVTFGLELRIPPEDSLTHTAAAARAYRMPELKYFARDMFSATHVSAWSLTILDEPGSVSMQRLKHPVEPLPHMAKLKLALPLSFVRDL